jgi:transcription termination factor Rho
MTKAELESKSLSDLHSLAAEAGVERYRMLSRAELVEKLGDGGGGGGSGSSARQSSARSSSSRSSRPAGERGERGERPQRRRRRRSGAGSGGGGGGGGDRAERPRREPAREKPRREPRPPESEPEPTPAPPSPTPGPGAEAPSRPRRRRRRFGRRRDQVSIQDLLLPPASGRQAILCAETREACTALLRGVAAELGGASKGPDPVVLLIDPSPEELAEWKREAPDAEIVAAGQARHASDALAQASSRAAGGEDVMLLVDSLTRLAAAYGDADSAREFFDAGRVQGGSGGGSLTVLAALERPAA